MDVCFVYILEITLSCSPVVNWCLNDKCLDVLAVMSVKNSQVSIKLSIF